jgi:hypothetical protein
MEDYKNHPDYQAYRDMISSLVKSGHGIEEIRNRFGRIHGEIFDLVLSDFVQEKKHVYILKDPAAIIAEELQTEKYEWYGGPGPHSIRWNALKLNLAKQNLSDIDLRAIDQASTRVVSLLPSPSSNNFSGRGLVIGYVQSGKTTNFMSTIAKAADEGYRLIIVLSGTTNNLRNQTQFRLERSLSSTEDLLTGHSWHWLTSLEHDFDTSANAGNLLGSPNLRVIAVVKKNKGRLTKLLKWLEMAPAAVRAAVPMLIIDDEADQASVNSAKQKARQTAINKLITSLLDVSLMPCNAYVGYTATPFANVLSDATDLKQIYPRDFIIPLDKNKGYFGAEELFGRQPIDENDVELVAGRNIVRSVLPGDILPLGAAAIRNPGTTAPPVFTESLGRAMMWFLIATATRRYRTKVIEFSTMLIHTSGPIAPHFEMKKLVESELMRMRDNGLSKHEPVFRALWDQENKKAYFAGDGALPKWEELWPIIQVIISDVKVVVDNYRSDDRLNFDFENQSLNPPTIVIGGNTLSRGLTLEGLVSSFFIRTSNTYDSMLQMGRWFGYRQGYEDLQRIWMQDDLIPLFRDLALVEEEIRTQIRQWAVNGIRPDEMAVRIRTHPSMNITAREKMLHAVKVQIGFSNQRVESIQFKNDVNWLSENIQATEEFIKDCQKSGFVIEENSKKWPLFKDLPWGIVKKYLSDYNWVEDNPKATLNLIVKYIEKVQSTSNELLDWNVYFYQLKNDSNPKRRIGSIDMSRITRSALMQNAERSNIHTLVSTIDGGADLPLTDKEIKAKVPQGKITDKSIIEIREQYFQKGKGLLGIYLINKNSKSSSERKQDLELPEDAIGLGFFFPNTNDQNAMINYVAAQLPDFETNLDEEDPDVLEAEDV